MYLDNFSNDLQNFKNKFIKLSKTKDDLITSEICLDVILMYLFAKYKTLIYCQSTRKIIESYLLDEDIGINDVEKIFSLEIRGLLNDC